MSNGPSFTLVDECDVAFEPDRFYGNAPLPAMRRLNFVGQGYMAPTAGLNVPYFPFRAIAAALADVRHAHARAQGVPDGKIDPHRNGDDLDYPGLLAEMIAALLTNSVASLLPRMDYYDLAIADGFTIDVKSTWHERGNILVPPVKGGKLLASPVRPDAFWTLYVPRRRVFPLQPEMCHVNGWCLFDEVVSPAHFLRADDPRNPTGFDNYICFLRDARSLEEMLERAGTRRLFRDDARELYWEEYLFSVAVPVAALPALRRRFDEAHPWP